MSDSLRECKCGSKKAWGYELCSKCEYEMQVENEQLKEKIKAEQKLTTLMNDDYTVLCSNHDKLKAERDRAREALIDEWANRRGFLPSEPEFLADKSAAQGRYKREIAQGIK